MTSRRDAASEQAQADLDGLLNLVLPFAEQALSEHGELCPFAAAAASDGQMCLLAVDPDALGGHPRSAAVLRALYDGAGASRDGRRAYAFAADVRAGAGDAVRVELEHHDGLALDLLVSYARSKLTKKITFGQISGGTGQHRVWTAS
jgi:hypothetical protein